jgi:glycolate oxidase FAD binding subunit
MNTALHQITDQIRAAAADHTPLCIRGQGSKDFYGEPASAQVLDTTVLSGIVSYEPTELVVTVRSGTPLVELEAALREQGQCLPFEPPRFGAGGTCGGMVAAGLSGPARPATGGVRDYVLGVQMINGRAEHLTFGGQVFKNVAGYDVTRLMVGGLGVLGVLTELSLKLLPMAPAEATLVFEVDQATALAQLQRWGGQPLPLNASCWMHDDTAPGAPQLLLVRLRGAAAAVQAASRKLLQDLPGHALDNAQAQPHWQACRDMTLPFFNPATHPGQHLWRLSLPPTTPELALPQPPLVEWHGAQRWVWAVPEQAKALRQMAELAGGSATLFISSNDHFTGAMSRFSSVNATLLSIHHRLKAEFDPAGILNPGRLFPTL